MPFNLFISHDSPYTNEELVKLIEVKDSSYQYDGFFNLPGTYKISVNESIYGENFEAKIKVEDIEGKIKILHAHKFF